MKQTTVATVAAQLPSQPGQPSVQCTVDLEVVLEAGALEAGGCCEDAVISRDFGFDEAFHLVGGLEHLLFSHIFGIIIPID